MAFLPGNVWHLQQSVNFFVSASSSPLVSFISAFSLLLLLSLAPPALLNSDLCLTSFARWKKLLLLDSTYMAQNSGRRTVTTHRSSSYVLSWSFLSFYRSHYQAPSDHKPDTEISYGGHTYFWIKKDLVGLSSHFGLDANRSTADSLESLPGILYWLVLCLLANNKAINVLAIASNGSQRTCFRRDKLIKLTSDDEGTPYC